VRRRNGGVSVDIPALKDQARGVPGGFPPGRIPLQQSFHIVMSMGKAQNPPATADAQNSPDASDPAQAYFRARGPGVAGVHHYPTLIVDIQLFKYDDFQLRVTDSEGNPAAVTPVGARGSGVRAPMSSTPHRDRNWRSRSYSRKAPAAR
jgi:Family of unknown function (DUF6424)